MNHWDPHQYQRFSDERSRPFFDLVGRVPDDDVRTVAIVTSHIEDDFLLSELRRLFVRFLMKQMQTILFEVGEHFGWHEWVMLGL